ncbi:hypothetical protein FACS189490_04310 [Clostridia bacterium]|nr:hypothetical protein FACS189490_04310 [Clostridia bacterium]
MALHIKHINGRDYVYDVKSVRDKTTKKVKKLSTYMGPLLDKNTMAFSPKKKVIVKDAQKRIILNYGDTRLLAASLKQSLLSGLFASVLPEEQDTLNALLCYKIIVGAASKDAEIWYEGNYASVLFPNAQMASQRISEFLTRLGDERVQRAFFTQYLSQAAQISGEVVIDSTGLPNEIDLPLTQFGHHGGEIEKENRMIMVIDRVTKFPLYFRLVAGNIADVSTLLTTFKLMAKLGVNPQLVIMDAGYCSDKNIGALYAAKTSFLTRLPAGRKLFKTLIADTNHSLESRVNAVSYNKRALFVQKAKTEICGHIGFAYVCCDVKQRGLKMDAFVRETDIYELTDAEFAAQTSAIVKFVLISDKDIPIQELLPLYYTRQIAEQTFGFSKSCLNLLPLRVHTTETLRGYAFLAFLALLLSVEIQNKLGSLCSLQDALSYCQNWFCEVYDNDALPVEPSKQVKEVFDKICACGS